MRLFAGAGHKYKDEGEVKGMGLDGLCVL